MVDSIKSQHEAETSASFVAGLELAELAVEVPEDN